MSVPQSEIDEHDHVTRTIIVGMMCDIQEGAKLSEVAAKIMDLLKSRGYEPQIRRCNQLKNGKNV